MKLVKAAVIAGAVALGIGFAGPTLAEHEHYIDTPGTCVDDMASGQTSKGSGEGGYHRFHDNVHKGQPGMLALENAYNPVGVDKGSCSPD
jgi:hypothetical protein